MEAVSYTHLDVYKRQGLLFQLKWKLLVIVLIGMFLALPAFILDTYKKMYEQKRFADDISNRYNRLTQSGYFFKILQS